MSLEDYRHGFLPSSMRSLADEVPPAPPGTVFVLSAAGGFTCPPRKFTIHFGRERDDVHVPVGVSDPYVSRQQGRLICGGHEWWLRNDGKLPIQLPGEAMLLSGYAIPLDPGYTPVLLGSARNKAHLMEIHVVGAGPGDTAAGTHSQTRAPEVYDLSPVERLVLTALAQRYLRGERYPQPVSWSQVADDLGRAVPETQWTSSGVAHRVAAVRERLSGRPHNVPGLLREDGVGEPVGNTLNHNLIQALLRAGTLTPADLEVLGDVG